MVVVCALLVLDSNIWGFSVPSALINASNPTLENSTPVLRYATIPSVIASVFLLFYLLRPLKIKAIVYVLAGIIFALVLFESLWHIVGYFSPSFNSEYPINIQGAVLLLVFWAVSIITVKFWHLGKLQAIILLFYALGWMSWLFSGYPQALSDSLSWIVYNSLLKGWFVRCCHISVHRIFSL